MITPFPNNGIEPRDNEASSFWNVLANKLGLKPTMVKQASSDELKIQRLSDGIQTQGQAPVRQGMVKVAGAVTKVSVQGHLNESVFDNIIAMHQHATAELGQAERVKAVDFLSRIGDQAECVKNGVSANCGDGDAKVTDLCGEITAKADAVIGAVTQLQDKAGEMTMAQSESIANAFLLINDAANHLGKMGAEVPMGEPGSMPEMELMSEGLPEEAPTAEGTPAPAPAPAAAASPIAGHVPEFVKKAAAEAYNDMRCVYTKMLLVESMLNEIVADLNVNTMMTPGMPEAGMPPTTEMPGPETPEVMREESEEQAAERGPAEAGLDGVIKTAVHPIEEMHEEFKVDSEDEDKDEDEDEEKTFTHEKPTFFKKKKKTAATGDPGDRELGNSVYKDINKCRDCVWFESDVTHETYRDKCKDCSHASLGGIKNLWWPRAAQMVIWAPQYEGDSEHVRLSIRDTLSLRQAAPTQAQSIAREIVAGYEGVGYGQFHSDSPSAPWNQKGPMTRWYGKYPLDAYALGPIEAESKEDAIAEFTRTFGEAPDEVWKASPGRQGCSAVSLGKAFVEAFRNPLIASQMGTLARGVVAEIEALTGVTMSRQAKDGNLIIAYSPMIEQEAKGEKAKIRELRQQLDGEKDPVKIKQLHEAIEALHERVSKDKERKEERRTQRQERKTKEQEELDKQHANIPAKTARGGNPFLTGRGKEALMENLDMDNPEIKAALERWMEPHQGRDINSYPPFQAPMERWDSYYGYDYLVENGIDPADYQLQEPEVEVEVEVEAAIAGTLCLADAIWPSDSPELGAGESFPVCPKCQKQHASNVPCAQTSGGAPVQPIVASIVGTLTSRGSL